MIGVDGQYLFRFKLGERDDFIREEDLILFKLVEEAGNVLPTFVLSFTTYEDDIIQYIHEGSDLEVSFGKDRSGMVDIKLIITRVEPIRSGDQKRMIAVTGMMSAMSYLAADRTLITDSVSGIEAMKLVASKYFDTSSTFNIEKSSGKMRWIQPNIPDRAFVNHCWMHSDVTDSFCAVGISSDGKFICKDIKKDLKTKFKWRFTSDIREDYDINYDGDFTIDLNSGMMNNWVGYPREKVVYNLEEGTSEAVMESTSPITALTKEIARRADIEKRYAMAGMINENVHENFWRAYLRNLSHLAMFSQVNVVLSFGNRFLPIRVLDQVMFKEDSVSRPKQESSEFLSGVYYVSKVARIVQNRQFATTVQICRESFNQLKGDHLEAPAPRAQAATPELTEAQTLLAELKSRFPGRF
jgi:hypothetical protein